MIDDSLLPTQRTRIVENDQNMKECDSAFKEYMLELRKTPIDVIKVQDSYSRYQITRNELNRNILRTNTEKFRCIIDNNDSKKLWASINWSGKLKKTVHLIILK